MWLEAVVVVLVVLQVTMLALLWRQGRRLQRSLAVKENDAGGVPALLLINALNKIDHRLSMLEALGQRTETSAPQRPVEVPATQMKALRSASHHSSASNYELAQQLAREGSDLEQLIARCGLSRNEAELVLRLYAKRA
ncbi:hypothetical protein GCM10007862_24530 [Dyella lipolytica]|uniref:DUF2802 domain-containing protein n=1 Tax=Dyella lipolytica TaxID=1867835 RepID=A0ABW8IT68_9GAMM|nr:DUF2802 domain-containing protein [Dyella lipolytica]GLQ47402.1 hypothetical protein GCM10007862_24530 [Dyella lipolytica]